MHMNRLSWKGISVWSVVVGTIVLSSSANAQTKTLKVGDPAPGFHVGKWYKGEPIKSLSRGHAYVVEFWATRCGPCVAGIPHLSGLAKRYRGKLDVAAVSVLHWQDDSPNDTPALVKAFMKTADGKAMGYHVAQDTDNAYMVKNWLGAAGFEEIPCAFVVGKDGKIAWMGSPKDLDTVLARIIR